MKFSTIVRHLTGFSTPVFGIQWSPSEGERAVAKRVITFLEDRRVLYNPSQAEDPQHCVQSVIDIRQFLTKELSPLDADGPLTPSLMAMRATCRKFLDTVQADDGRIIRFGSHHGHYASWVFLSALGELRGVFGVHVAMIAVRFGVDVEKDLATILPAD